MANQWLKQYCQFCISPKSAKATLTKAFSVMMLSACIVGGWNYSVNAKTTTGDFLKWERKTQDAFLQNSISMALVIASQTDVKIKKCIDEWYFGNAEIRNQRNDKILLDMQNLKAYLPQAVLLAIIEDACGRYPKN